MIPDPVSDTVMNISLLSWWYLIIILIYPQLVNFNELLNRFNITYLSLAISEKITSGISFSVVNIILSPLISAYGSMILIVC